MNLKSIERLCQIVRHHRFSQLRLRVMTRARRKLFDKFRAKAYPSIIDAPSVRDDANLTALVQRHLQVATHHSSEWLNGEFEFLGDSRQVGMPPCWTTQFSDVSRLWRFHLHYHDFLLAAFDGNRLDERAWVTVFDWIDNYPICSNQATSDGWHPFCISKRLVNWVALWCIAPPTERQADVLGSIASQADFLMNNPEIDLGGNHLIENAHALSVVSAFFDESDRWANVAVEILRSEFDEQFLSHGEHFERSPMYHKHMIVALLDIQDTIQHFCSTMAERCGEAALKAIDFLGVICHQDGEIPLLGDAVLDDGPSAKSLSEEPSTQCGTNSIGGYWVYEDKDSKVVFDRAPAGPDHLMGHAHADLLNVVCSIQGQRWIVDTGVFDYADSDMRQHCRSTAAHNVLEVDGENQFDMWSGFRVGRRGWPLVADGGSIDLGEKHAKGRSLEQWASAKHDAYRHLKVDVGRWVACGRLTICCVDWIEGRSSGSEHHLVSRIHLHPCLRVEHADGEVTVRSPSDETPDMRVWALDGDITVRDGWYCPSFGRRERNSVVEISRGSRAPSSLGWLMSQSCDVTLVNHQRFWQLLDLEGEQVFRHDYGE